MRLAVYVRFPYRECQVHEMATSMGGDWAKMPAAVATPDPVLLRVPPAFDQPISHNTGWTVTAPGTNRLGSSWSNSLANFTIYKHGRMASMSVVGDKGDRLQKHRLLHEGCGVLARAVVRGSEQANTRYDVYWMALDDQPPVVYLSLTHRLDALAELTRPATLDDPSTRHYDAATGNLL
jgi:hypothetical protein